jgi:hypothetical protein
MSRLSDIVVRSGRVSLVFLLAPLAIGICWRLGGADQTASSAGPLAVHPPPIPPLAAGWPSDKHLDKTPPRAIKGLALVKLGWTYDCMECHKLLPAKWRYDRPMVEHQNIQLEHGNNRFCLNCHHSTDRNAFVDYDGSSIAQADVVQLCAKCHGMTHRDWVAGVHGRQNGFWNSETGPKSKLQCIQCHDPHRPAFQAMKPMPPLTYPPRAAYPSSARPVPAQTHP